MRNKRFKAIIASLLIVAIMIVQVSQMQVIYGMTDSDNTVSLHETSTKPELRSVVEDTYSTDEVIINEIVPTVLATGGKHSLQVREDGTVWAWGDNYYGQLGNGTTTNSTIAVQVRNLEDVVAVSAGYNTSIALKSDGTVWMWGGNEEEVNSLPLQVAGLKDITSISAGFEHYLALKSDGTVWGWGDNFYRQLGDGVSTEIKEPVQIKGLKNIKDISAGYWHSLALKSDGTVWALGYNYRGQLGNGTFTDSSTPVKVSDLSNVVGISAGEEFSLALRSDGTVWAWGDNTYCQLGVETYPDESDSYTPIPSSHNFQPSEVPLQINGLKNMVGISAGYREGMALKSDGTVWWWGGSSTRFSGINQVEGLSDITLVVAGDYGAGLALDSDERVWAWGDNSYGQLGDGTTEYRSLPVISKDITAPEAPTELVASISETGVILSWEASTDEGCVAGYEIYRDSVKIGTTEDTTYIDTGVKDASNYHKYTVKCYDLSGNISEGAVIIINDKEAPSVPMNLKVIQKTTRISIEWEPSTDNAWVAGYVVYRNGEKVGETDSNSFSESNLTHNTTYTYTVKAYDSSDNFSEASSPLVVETETIKSVALSANYNHSLQVREDGTVWAWGYNSYGQLGDGTTLKRVAAVKVKNLEDMVAVAAGEQFSLALKNDGTVWAWGYNGNRQLGDGSYSNKYQPVMLYILSDIISIEAGRNHSIALESDGTVWTWGANGYGQLGKGNYYSNSYPSKVDTLDNVIAITAGGDFSVALKSDGTVWAWGSNSSGQLGEGSTKSSESIPVQIDGLTDIIDVKAGNNHVLALKSDGTVWAWGGNAAGQLGNETKTNSKVPVQVNGLTDVIDIGAGNVSSIALKKDGTVWTWGSNEYGQLGDGTTTTRLSPVQVEGLSDVVDVVMGSYHSFALKSDETVWAWGSNSGGMLGDETEVNKKTPVLSGDKTPPSIPANISVTKFPDKIVLTWDASTDLMGVAGYEIYRDDTKIATTTTTTYTDADLSEINRTHIYYVKAFDNAGNLSEGAKVVVNDGEAPSKPLNVKAISNSPTTVSLEWEPSTDNVLMAGYEIYRDGNKVGTSKETKFTDKEIPHNKTYTYTVKAYDESGNYSIESDTISVTTGMLKTVPIAAGDNHSLLIKSDGTVWACGDNSNGQLGDGTKEKRIEAVQVNGLENIVAVTAGRSYSAALMNNGTVWTWGNNEYGKLGNGTTDYWSYVPVKVSGLNDVIDVKAGYNHCIALKGDGTVWAWGDNYYGELGNGSTINSNVPVHISGLSNIIGIAAGKSYSIALKGDGTVWAWGYNYYGQLGDGTKNNSSVPIKISNLDDVIDVKAGGWHILALKRDGTVWAWGNNIYGQLGNGTTIDSYVPVQVKDLNDIKEISVYCSYHNLSLKSDGTVWTWGANYYGQLGNDTTINSAVPVKISELADVTAIVAGEKHSLAQKSDGTVWAWGANSYGQLGDGTGINRIVPVPMDNNPIFTTVISGFSAKAEQNGIKLFWNLKTEDYVYGYKIYRSEAIDGPYTMITQLNRSEMEYLDKNYEVGNANEPSEKTFYYKISAIDKFGNESNKSDAVSVVAKTDSIAPVILSIEPGNNKKIASRSNIYVKAEDNFGISEITLQYSLDGTEWIDISTQDKGDFLWNTPDMNGTVYVRAIAKDLAGNVSEESPIVTYIIDRMGPSKVTGLKAIPSASSIVLNWDDVPEDDLWYFQVECKNSSGQFVSVAVVYDKRGVELKNLQPETVYTYRVRALDLLGNVGEVSDEISVTTIDDVTAPVVTYLGPASNRYGNSITLKATIYDNASTVSEVFQISRDKINWTDIKSFDSIGSNFSISYTYDTSSIEEGYIYIRCIATDASGNVSSGAPVNEYYIDHTAPLKPSNVKALSTSGYVELKWDKGVEEDLYCFNIYRSVDNGDFLPVANSYNYLNYVDRNVNNTSTYKYRISAVDIAGNESEFYETESISLLSDNEKPKILSVSPSKDTTLPANPTISVLAEDNALLESITVKYRKSGTNDEWVSKVLTCASKSNCLTEFKWATSGLTDGSYDFVFTAKDTSANLSDEYKITFMLNVSAPEAPVLKAKPLGWKVELTWSASKDTDLARYHILRHDSTNANYKILYKTTGTSYTDTTVEAGKTYYYVVDAVDQYLNTSRSNAVSVVPTDEDEEKPVAVISAESFSTTNTLMLFDSRKSSDNHKVEKVLWDFGDGTVSSEIKTYHSYSVPGDYKVKLTVYDSADNFSSSEKIIKIYPQDAVSKVKVNVLDKSTGTGIPGAEVVLRMSDGTDKVLITDDKGLANFIIHSFENEQLGGVTAYAFRNGYTPASKELASLKAGEESTIVVRMEKGNVVEGNLSVKRMTLEEVKAAGIDVTAPENQYVYSFNIHLGYKLICNNNGQIYVDNKPKDYVTYKITESDSSIKSVYVYTVPSKDPKQPPNVVYIELPGDIKTLKEFFMVNLVVKNLSESEDIVLEGATSTLNIPSGLTLVNGEKTQPLTPENIPGGSSANTSWILRGDNTGVYSISANFQGILQPFNEIIEAVFSCAEPIVVEGSEKAKVIIEVEKEKKPGDIILYRVGFQNGRKAEMDSPQINMKDSVYIRSYKTDSERNLVGTSSKTLKSGEIFWSEYYVDPVEFGDWKYVWRKLSEYTSEALNGTDIPIEIIPVDYGTFGRVKPEIYIIDPKTGRETLSTHLDLVKYRSKANDVMPDIKIKTSRNISENEIVKEACELTIEDSIFGMTQTIKTDSNGEYIYKGGSIDDVEIEYTYCNVFGITVAPDVGVTSELIVRIFDQNLMPDNKFGNVSGYVWNQDESKAFEGATVRVGSDSNICVTDSNGRFAFKDIIFDDNKIIVKAPGYPDKVMTVNLYDGLYLPINMKKTPEVTKVVSWCSDSSNIRSSILPLNFVDNDYIVFRVDADLKGASEIKEYLWRIVDKHGNIKHEGTSGNYKYIKIEAIKSKMAVGDRIKFAIKTEGEYGNFISDYVDAKLVLAPELTLLNNIAWASSMQNDLLPDDPDMEGLDGCVEFFTGSDTSIDLPEDSGVFKSLTIIPALRKFDLDVDYDFKNARLKVNTTTGKDGTGFSGELFTLDVGKGEKEGNFGIRPKSEANVSIDIVYNDVTLKWELESMDIKMENGVTIKLEFKYSVPLDAYFGGMLLSGYAYVEIEGGINFIVDVSIPDVSKLDSLEDLIAKIEANVWLSVKGAIGAEVGYGLLSGDLYLKGRFDINIPSLRTTFTFSHGYEYGYLWFFSEEETFGDPKTFILFNGIKQKNLLRMLSNFSSTETGLISDSEENNGEIIFKSAPRDYLDNQKWIGKDEIIQDAYPDSDAQIAAIDKEIGELMMVFIGDDSDRSDNNRTTISSSIYKNGTWSEPIQIEDDGTGDAFPDIAVDGKDIYAAWLDMTEELGETENLSEDDITKNVLCKMGITISQYNAATNSWNNVLTKKTEGANKLPKITVKDGKILATWVNNRAGKAIGNKLSPDNLYYVYNNGGGWTEPKAFLTDVSNVYESDLYLSGDKAYYVFVTDAYSEDGLYKLYVTSFDGENWSVPKEVLDNMYADSHPSIAVENGEPVAFWQNNNVIYKTSLKTPDKAQIVVNSEQAEDILELSATNTDAGLALAWTKASAGEQRVYVSTYEQSSSTWTAGTEIKMNSMEIPKNLTIAGLEDSVMVVYNKNIYKLNEENSYYKDSTSLTSTVYVRNVDLAIAKDGLYFAEGSPIPGDKTTVIATVENVGDLTTKGMKVSLYEGEKLIDQKELPDLQLSSGDQSLVSFDWVVPGNSTGFTLRAVVEAKNDSNTSNNTAQLEQSYTDLEVTGVHNELYTKNTGFVYVDVTNIGYSSIKNAKVYLATDKEFKNIIATKEIDNLGIFSEKRVVFDLEVSDEQIASRSRIYAKVDTQQNEINNFNNSDFTVIRPCELDLVGQETGEPGTDEPGTGEPGTGEPGTDEPGTEEPGTGEPGTGNPGTGNSGGGNSGGGNSGGGNSGGGNSGGGNSGGGNSGGGNSGGGNSGGGNSGGGNSGGGNSGGGNSGGGNAGAGNPGTGNSGIENPKTNDPTNPDNKGNPVTDPAEPSNPVTEPTPDTPTSGKSNKAYIRGYSDNTFRPEQSITIAEMAVILANLDGASKDNQTVIEFKDVPRDHWAVWAITYVSKKGYFKGYEDGTYKPDRYITRAELCVVLGNYMKMESAIVDENKLTDIKGHWAQKYIYMLISKGYVKGYPDDTFRPNNNIKRSECVTLINRVLGIESIKDAEIYFTDVDKSHWAFGDIMAAILND